VVVTSAESGSHAVMRPWLGAKLQEVTADIADSLGLKAPTGALVASVSAGSPAADAGLKAGDLIVSVDGATVADPNGFDYRFATKPLGGTAQVGIRRQGREMVVPVALKPIPNLPSDQVAIGGHSPFTGATVANLTPALADQLRLDTQGAGVVVTAVADGSTAESIGFRPGDIVVSVNNHKIERSADLSHIADSGSHTWRITIRRGNQQISVVFSG
jgi:S1-C subfamily serine protease